MTSQSPRIYIYKITFEEIQYYYYGVHKEKKYNEYYMGSPKTHKWCWDFYTPKKQILQFFEFSDEGWLEANKIEKRIIKQFYNTDKWCLNECCGGTVSLKINRETGRKVSTKNKKNKTGLFGISNEKRTEVSRKNGLNHKKNKTGIFSISKERRIEINRKNGLDHKKNKTGLFKRTKEEMIEQGRKNGLVNYQNKIGIHGMTFEEKSLIGKRNGLKHKENKTGVCGISKEQKIENGRRGGLKSGKMHKENGTGIFSLSKEQLSENARKNNSQKWMCLETGFITNAGNLSRYQKARKIDTSKRIRIE